MESCYNVIAEKQLISNGSRCVIKLDRTDVVGDGVYSLSVDIIYMYLIPFVSILTHFLKRNFVDVVISLILCILMTLF